MGVCGKNAQTPLTLTLGVWEKHMLNFETREKLRKGTMPTLVDFYSMWNFEETLPKSLDVYGCLRKRPTPIYCSGCLGSKAQTHAIDVYWCSDESPVEFPAGFALEGAETSTLQPKKNPNRQRAAKQM